MSIDPLTAPRPRRPHKEQGSCIHCHHGIGYHHLEGEKCSCKDCPCPGYEGYPQPENSNFAAVIGAERSERLQKPVSGRDIVEALSSSPLDEVTFDRLTIRSDVRDVEL